MLKILIVEDQVLIADYIQSLLIQNNFANVDKAYDQTVAIEKSQSFNPDIVLLDINLTGNNEGIDLAKNHFADKGIIFLTAQNDDKTIAEAIATNPFSYLSKPIKPTDLITAVKLLSNKLRQKTIVLQEGTMEFVFNLEDIMYIKSSKNYVDVYTTANKISIRYGISKIFEKLPKDIFLQIHRTLIINSNHVQKRTKSFVEINQIKFPISRNFRT